MPSILPGYEYDIFISYRQNDNKRDGWVTKFVSALQDELDATVKEKISIYFDENPYDGIGANHDVDDSLAKKLKCLIFIPIISKTYCDPNSFAWTNEFLAFKSIASKDEYGLKVELSNGNTSSRILPIRIHDIDPEDKMLVEKEIGFLRSIDFVYKEPGVNRPLGPDDSIDKNIESTNYKNQINKVANSIHEIIKGVTGSGMTSSKKPTASASTLRSSPAAANNPKKSKKGIIYGVLAILMVAIASYFLLGGDSEMEVTEIDKSIAVLPFNDLSQGGDQQYFADGVMEDILTQLQRMKELNVISRTSVETYRNTNKRVPQIGAELGVNYLLEGSIRKAGNQVMITAQLIRTNDDNHLWANNFTEEYNTESLFEIQRTIAEKIVEELKLNISPNLVKEITEAQTNNEQAYEHYLKGRSLYALETKSSLEESVVEFRKAIALDPNYSAAYGGLANSYAQLTLFGYSDNWVDTSEFYARKGIVMDENCAVCYKAIALNYQNRKTIREALLYYNKALDINPNYVMALSNSMELYLILGDFKSALARIIKLEKIAPKRIAFNLASLYSAIGDFETSTLYWEKNLNFYKGLWDYIYLSRDLFELKANDRYAEVYEESLRLSNFNTDNPILKASLEATTAWMEGDYEKTIEFYKDASAFSDPRIFIESYVSLGMSDKALQVLEDYGLLELYGDSYGTFFYQAVYFTISGDTNKALEYIEKAVKSNYMINLSGQIVFEPLQEHPKFKELVEVQRKRKEEILELVSSYNFPRPEDL